MRRSFAAQAFMAAAGVRLDVLQPGHVELALAFREDLTQQHGFLHAGVVTAAVDSACGFAALSLMEPGAAVLSVEFKLNLLAPAAGDRFRAVGDVVRAGRTLTVCRGELRRDDGGDARPLALLQATMMTVRDRGLTD